MDEFGYVEAEFIPYFDDKPPATTAMKDVYVSAYKREDIRTLLVVGNLSREDRHGAVPINAARVGVPMKKVVSWPGGQPVDSSPDGAVQLSAPKLGYPMLVVSK